MPYQKIAQRGISVVNATLDIEYEKVKNTITSYCQWCGEFLIAPQGRFIKYDSIMKLGPWYHLLCDSCAGIHESRLETHGI